MGWGGLCSKCTRSIRETNKVMTKNKANTPIMRQMTEDRLDRMRGITMRIDSRWGIARQDRHFEGGSGTALGAHCIRKLTRMRGSRIDHVVVHIPHNTVPIRERGWLAASGIVKTRKSRTVVGIVVGIAAVAVAAAGNHGIA